MSQLKYCQGPKCHTYDTKDRKKGPKDNKTNQTRRRSSFYYLGRNACSMQCMYDWYDQYGEQMTWVMMLLTLPKLQTLIMKSDDAMEFMKKRNKERTIN